MLIRKKHLTPAVKILISGGLLALIFSQIPLDGVADAMRGAAWDIVGASFLVMCLARYLKSVQMYYITRHLTLTLSPLNIFSVNLVSMFYGLFLPGVIAGGAIRWYYMSRQDNKPVQALAAIILSRVLETSMLLCLGFGFWFVDVRAAETISIQLLFLLVVMSVLIYMITFSRRAHAVLFRLADFRLIPDWIRIKISKVLSALGEYEDLPRLQHVTILLIALSYHVLGLASLYLLALALPLDVDLVTLGWIRSVVAIAMFVPVTIAGLGVREATYIAFLIPYGVAMNDALALSLLVFSRGLAFAAIGGLIEAKRYAFGNTEYAK